MNRHADVLSETDSGETSEQSGSDEDVASWISWFCSLKGNEFFCEVEDDFIQDDFNLSGLSSQVPYYDYALDLILDSDTASTDILTEEQHELVERADSHPHNSEGIVSTSSRSAAEMLYGLIHVRFILTSRGMSAMFEKYKVCEFGRCPRVLCNGQPCLPVGTADVPRQSTVKIFCPRCKDIYFPRSKYQGNVDGAYFGTTFPHLLLMTYPSLRPPHSTEVYTPRVFGFKLHATADPEVQEAQQQAAGSSRLQQLVQGSASADKAAATVMQQDDNSGNAGGGDAGMPQASDQR